MSDERIEDLQRELRERLKADLSELKLGQAAISAQLSAMNEKCAKVEAMNDIEERVTKLESDRSKIIGAMVIFQFIGGIALFVLGKLWK